LLDRRIKVGYLAYAVQDDAAASHPLQRFQQRYFQQHEGPLAD
jgi:hypothetical protein